MLVGSPRMTASMWDREINGEGQRLTLRRHADSVVSEAAMACALNEDGAIERFVVVCQLREAARLAREMFAAEAELPREHIGRREGEDGHGEEGKEEKKKGAEGTHDGI